MDFSVSMALFDFVPVALFAAASVLLQRTFYGRMSKGCFAVYSSGTILVTVAGIFKAVWKLLYALAVCDFAALNTAFLPMQSTGFLLAAAALLAFVFRGRRRGGERLAAAVPVYASSMPFIAAMVLGVLGLSTGYAVLAVRRGKKAAAALFALAFFLQLGMGYLSSKDFAEASMNWIAEAVNTGAQLALLLGARMLRRAWPGEDDEAGNA